jgi:hypothetical protein
MMTDQTTLTDTVTAITPRSGIHSKAERDRECQTCRESLKETTALSFADRLSRTTERPMKIGG